MIAAAIERGDRRSEPEVVAALLVGAELTAERHHDPAMRLRGRRRGPVHDRLLALVGHDEAVWLSWRPRDPWTGRGARALTGAVRVQPKLAPEPV